MMNDPCHKAMLYFLEVIMNSDAPVTLDHLAARFSHKSFSPDMRDACGGGSSEGLRDFLLRYPSLFNVLQNGEVKSVAIDVPGTDGTLGYLSDLDSCLGLTTSCPSISNDSERSITRCSKSNMSQDSSNNSFGAPPASSRTGRPRLANKPTSLLSTPSSASTFSDLGSAFSKLSLRDHCTNNHQNHHENAPLKTHCTKHNAVTSTWNQMAAFQDPKLGTPNQTKCDLHTNGTSCCGQSFNNTTNPFSGTTCIHYPILDLSCHHHCTVTHHHHHLPTTHCLCSATSIATKPLCHHCYPTVSHMSEVNPISAEPTSTRAFPPLDTIMLETEAVRFFQQRLLKRDERWVSIKSLAGHLSQATAGIRAIVGPQLDFRSFLLKHPHVFEVQGELVSVKDPFRGLYPARKPRDKTSFMHASLSSNSLLGNFIGVTQPVIGSIRDKELGWKSRPKSLILPESQQLFPSFYKPVTDSAISSVTSNKRSPQLFDDLTANYAVRNVCTSSAPNTPTGPTPVKQSQKISWNNRSFEDEFESLSQSNEMLSNELEKSSELRNWTNSNSISIAMSANEYRATMFLRKVLEKRGGKPNESGLSLCEIMQILFTKAPDSVKCTIGWTILELEEFMKQRSIFFDVTSVSSPVHPIVSNDRSVTSSNNTSGSNNNVVRNKRLERMINIMITSTNNEESNAHTLTNKCGRIFHIAKLWGIIDLGKHEHVFFDKSLLKHVDDLQKYFKVDEILYFNAILAPKESRAKWRATRVWKECDREYFARISDTDENLMIRAPTAVPETLESSENDTGKWERGLYLKENDQITQTTADCAGCNENDDTEAEEDIQDIVVENKSGMTMTTGKDTALTFQNDSDSEFALHEDEEIDDDEPFVSAIARQEGLHLTGDIKFIADESTIDMDDVNYVRNACQSTTLSSHRQNKQSILQKSNLIDMKPLILNNEDDEGRNNFVSSSTEQTPSECYSFRTGNFATGSKDNAVTSISSAGSSKMSIAVQTVATGEIMATHLYHDPAKQSCTS